MGMRQSKKRKPLSNRVDKGVADFSFYLSSLALKGADFDMGYLNLSYDS